MNRLIRPDGLPTGRPHVSEGMAELPQLWLYAAVREGAIYVQDLDFNSRRRDRWNALRPRHSERQIFDR